MRNFRFEYNKTFIVKLAQHKIGWWRGKMHIVKKVFWVVGSLGLGFWLYQAWFQPILTNNQLKTLIGSALLLFGAGFICWMLELFFGFEMNYRPLEKDLSEALNSPEPSNLASYLDYSVARGLLQAQQKSGVDSIDQVPVLTLSAVLFQANGLTNFLFSRLLIDNRTLQKRISQIEEKSSLPVGKVLFWAAQRAAQDEKSTIEVGDVLVSLVKRVSPLNELFLDLNLSVEDIDRVVEWYEFWNKNVEQSQKFWRYKNLIRKGGVAQNWAAAYTLALDKYSINWTERAKQRGGQPEMLGHRSEIEQIENILASSGRNNVLLVGQPGSGQKDITLSLAAKSFWGTSLPELNNKRILELDLGALVSKTPSSREIELKLDKCFEEAVSAGNIIVVMDNIHNFLGRREVGTVNIINILSKYLRSSRFQVIAITSYEGLHQNISPHSSLMSLFNQVEVTPPSIDQTFKILQLKIPYYERKYSAFIPYPSLKKIIEYSARYFKKRPFPRKALDLLDQVLVYASRHKEGKMVYPKYVDQVVANKTKIPVGKLERSEKEMLINLEDLIHQRIINQSKAVQEMASALRRARTEITTKREQPMGGFLFLGPTGVGKTETAKTLADLYFGSRDRMIRLDMSEFQNVEDIPRLIGDEQQTGLLTSQVREEPFSLVLIDEIEKAHPNILNLFLTVLDEGYITDGHDRKVSFSDTIIICTSNAGAEIIHEDIRKDMNLDLVREELIDHLLKENIFRPEFINRFSAVVIFRTLSKDNLLDIAQLKLEQLQQRMKEKNIDFVINDTIKEQIVDEGYDPAFGARELDRVIQSRVENKLANALLRNKIGPGDKITLPSFEKEIKKLN